MSFGLWFSSPILLLSFSWWLGYKTICIDSSSIIPCIWVKMVIVLKVVLISFVRIVYFKLIYFTSIAKQAFSFYLSRSMSASWRPYQYSRNLCGVEDPKVRTLSSHCKIRYQYPNRTCFLCNIVLYQVFEVAVFEKVCP